MLEVSARKKLEGRDLNMDLTCEADGVIALFGRSGAGKTSLANMLAGLLKPDSGRIVLRDTVLFDSERGIDLPPEARRLGYVFQEGRLFPHMKVRHNLTYGYRRLPEAERHVQPEQIVELLDLGALLERRPRDLSGGEKQRVALGRALLANPRLLLMDEPLAALDQPRREEVLPFIERLGEELDIPIVYISHAMEEIMRLAETMVLISDGRVAAVGSVPELTSRLDLRPLTGRYEAGSVFDAKVLGHDQDFSLTRLGFAGGTLQVPRLDLPPGDELRIRIRARDVVLARQAPPMTSVLNVFEGTVQEVSAESGALVDVLLDLKGAPLWARITAKSKKDLGIEPGNRLHALIKAVAVDRHALGRRGRRSANPRPDS